EGFQSKLEIYIPIKPDTLLNHIPKLEFIEYLSYIGGCVSMWMGFSVVTTIFDIGEFLEKVRTAQKKGKGIKRRIRRNPSSRANNNNHRHYFNNNYNNYFNPQYGRMHH